MRSIKLVLGCHAHQPVGNFDFVFADAYRHSYLPFIDVLERYPHVKCTLHFTGPLFDWFVEHAPEFLKRLAKLASAGQIEIMGGGYYEPLICAIPERDALAQIKRMNKFCKKHFGARPNGMWLTERVWEPHMAHTLTEGGLKYTALDDTHFMNAGLRPEDLYGYYMTEDNGAAIAVFPIQEKLRYLVPFHQVRETMDYLKELATEEGTRVVVLHDDYEKFGVWPGTYHSVYEEGWLEEFFEALTANRDWLMLATYSEILSSQPALGRIYIPCASYKEMMVWTLTTAQQKHFYALEEDLKQDAGRYEQFKPFLKGSFWRNFLAKYPESNNVHKRMLRVSKRLDRLKKRHKKSKKFAAALKTLHQAQCNCAYWHGVFGGLYLNHLRTAIYQKCIEADVLLDACEKKSDFPCEQSDVDGDGQIEVVLENRELIAFIKPGDGGTIYELDWKSAAFNFFNTLSRREEPYHAHLLEAHGSQAEADEGKLSIHDIVRVKESGLEKYLIYDPCRRAGLRDRLFPVEPDLAAFTANATGLGSFVTREYAAEETEDGIALASPVLDLGNGQGTVRIRKELTLVKNHPELRVHYEISNMCDRTIDFAFGTELTVNLLAGDAPDRYFISEERDLNRPPLIWNTRLAPLSHIGLVDEWLNVAFHLRLDEAAAIYTAPIETVSQSEGGQERVYQGSIVMPCWPLSLEAGARQSMNLTITLVSNRKRKDS
ncbi:MAG: DUF1926 domain-containing protein [Candidatus Hydrogenedentes bacterium]|nr:DUF1926 domain-containing protein [Candidatus Hydrogenedentota bacterium]